MGQKFIRCRVVSLVYLFLLHGQAVWASTRAKAPPLLAKPVVVSFEPGRMAVTDDGNVYLIENACLSRLWRIDADMEPTIVAGIPAGVKCIGDELNKTPGPDGFHTFIQGTNNRLVVAGLRSLWWFDGSGEFRSLTGRVVDHSEGSLDGLARWARFVEIRTLAKTPSGDTLVLEWPWRNGDVVRKVTSAGEVTTIFSLPIAWRKGGEKQNAEWASIAAGVNSDFYVCAVNLPALVHVDRSGKMVEMPLPPSRFSMDRYNGIELCNDDKGNLYAFDKSEKSISVLANGKGWRLLPNFGSYFDEDGEGGLVGWQDLFAMAVDAWGRVVVAARVQDRTVVARLSPSLLDGQLPPPEAAWAPEPREIDEGGECQIIDSPDPGEDSSLSKQSKHNTNRLPPGVLKKLKPRTETPVGTPLYTVRTADRARELLKILQTADTVPDEKSSTGITGAWLIEQELGRAFSARIPRGGIAVDGAGNVLLTDPVSHTVVRISPKGRGEVYAGCPNDPGKTNGVGRRARFYEPQGIVPAFGDSFIILDSDDDKLRLIEGDGLVYGYGMKRGAGEVGAMDQAGTLYLASCRAGELTTISASGESTKSILFSDPGQNKLKIPDGPCAVTASPSGSLVIAVAMEQVIIERASDGRIARVIGQPLDPGSSDGPAERARFFFPSGIASDSKGKIFVADSLNHTIRVIDPNGNVSTLAGSPGKAGYKDGRGGGALFDTPSALAWGRDERLYVFDQAGLAVRIVSPSGAVRTLFLQTTESEGRTDHE